MLSSNEPIELTTEYITIQWNSMLIVLGHTRGVPNSFASMRGNDAQNDDFQNANG